MRKQLDEAKSNFKVVCAYCKAVIRRDAYEDAEGMCLDCYHRIITKHLRSGQHADSKALNASER